MNKYVLSLSVLLMMGFSSALKADVNDQALTIPHIQQTIELDGQLQEAHWQQAKKVQLNYITRPYENTKPPVKTTALLYEDGETLYVAFEANDPDPDAIRAYYRDRDSSWGQDLVGIKLDTFNNSRLAYQFFVNPFGVQADSIENELTRSESDSWDAIWQSKGQIHANGYTVEVAIPLRVLSFNKTDGDQQWKMELVRYYPRQDTLRISNMTVDRNNFCNLCQMGAISGFAHAKQGKNLALAPTLVVGKGRSRDLPKSPEWKDTNNQEVGLDINWGISPEASMQVTLNPDFSQVESDVAQLSINNTFSLFFNEKRPFFLENADYFSTNYNLVYTRNISAPDYGAKVSGRMQQHTFGLFVVNDDTTQFVVPGNIGSRVARLKMESTNAALRYRYDWSDELSVGWITTLRQADDYHNYVVGVDGKYQPTSSDTFRVQVIRSQTQNPDNLYKKFCNDDCKLASDYTETALRTQTSGEYADLGFRFNYRHDERDWYARADHYSNGRNLRADMGFMPKADRHTSVLGGGYRWYNPEESGWWNQVSVGGDWDIHHNDEGELLEKEIEANVAINTVYEGFFKLGAGKRQRVGNRQIKNQLSLASSTLFDEHFLYLVTEARPVPQVFFSNFISTGKQIDFANNRLGDRLRVEAEVELSLGRHFQLDMEHTYSKMEVDNQPLFTANLTDLRMTYQFDQRQFLRLILIYSDIERNPANYLFDTVKKRSQSLGSQLLYSYKVNPLTKFFVGYASGAVKNDDVRDLKDEEQSVFLKLSYAWLN